MSVNIEFDRRIHRNDSESPDDFRRVRNELRAQEDLALVFIPGFVESLESGWRKANRGRRGESEFVLVEEIEESVLNYFSPDSHVFERSMIAG